MAQLLWRSPRYSRSMWVALLMIGMVVQVGMVQIEKSLLAEAYA